MNWIQKQMAKLLLPSKLYESYGSMLFNTPVFLRGDARSLVDKGYLYNPDVYAVVNKITKTASGVPEKLEIVTDEKAYNKIRNYKGLQKFNIKSALYEAKALEQIDSHDILKVLKNPNEIQSGELFRENAIGYKLITGNNYIYGLRPENGVNKGMIQQMQILPAQFTEIIAGGGDSTSIIKGFRINAWKQIDFTPDEILHQKYWNPDYNPSTFDHLYGLPPLRAFSRVITTSNDNYDASAKLLQNTGIIGLMFNKSENYTGDQAKEVRDKWNSTTKGQWGKTHILSGDWGYHRMAMNMKELGLVDLRSYNLQDICNAFGIDSSLLNDSTNKDFATAQAARKSLYIDVVIPILDSYYADLNKWLVEPYSRRDNKKYVLSYDINQVPEMQEDYEKLRNSISKIWELTPNERLRAMGFPVNPDPNMDKIWMPNGLVPMEYYNQNVITDEMLKSIEYGLERKEK
jgi:HK97 family phage portal protein